MDKDVTERGGVPTETVPSGHQVLGRVYLLVALVAAVVVCSMVYVYLTDSRIVAEQVPWIGATMQIRLEATTGHLWFEEAIGGDPTETIDGVLEHLANAQRYADAMLAGGDTPSGTLHPFHDPYLRARMTEVRDALAEFRQITLQRWEARDESGIGTDIDQQYDTVFRTFVQQTQDVEAALQQFIAAEFRRAKAVEMSLIGICLAATIAVGGTLSHLVRRRLRVEMALQTANRELEVSNRHLLDREKQLRASNQQLDAGNQQLRASEQQMRALNQQLSANNQQLRASQEQIEGLARFPDENPDPVLRATGDGTILYANRAAQILLACFQTRVGAEIPAEWGVSMAEVLAGGGRREVEVRCRDCIYLFTLAPVAEAGYVNAYAHDITVRKEAHEQLNAANQQLLASNQQLQAAEQQLRAANQQLQASNQQLRASQEEVRSQAKFPAENPDPVLRVARDSTVLYANEAGAKLLECSAARVGAALPASWGVSPAEVMDGAVRREVEVQVQGNTYLLALAPVIEGQYVNVYGRDISGRVQAETEVRRARDRAQSYLDIAGVILVALDSQGKVTLINKKGAALLGWEEADVLGKDWFAHFVPAAERSVVAGTFRELVQGRLEPVEYFENAVQTKDGTCRTIAWHNTMLRDPAGRIIGTLSSGEDVTDRKKAEAQLRSLVSQLTTTEERGRKELAGVLHDGFIQNLALCKMRLEQARAAGASDEVRAILEGAIEGIIELITEMRTMTFELCSPVLYTMGLEAAIQDWLDNQVQGKHDTEFYYEDDGQARELDEGLSFFLFRATRELCTNVIKHAKAETVEVSVRTEDGMVRIDVKDDGVGMAASDSAQKGDEQGGLGLFSIRERLDHFGGRMHVKTKPEAGTHITILAPLNCR